MRKINYASCFGWKKGFEPSTLGTTIRYSNQLSYIHHVFGLQRYIFFCIYEQNNNIFFIFIYLNKKM